MSKFNLSKELDLFLAIGNALAILSEFYKKTDRVNYAKIQESALILREVLDSRVSKFDPSLREGLV